MINRINKLFLFLTMVLMPLVNFAQIRVAILPTTDKSGEVKYALKLLLTSSLTTAISTTEGYEAYDRIDLSSVLDEQSFQRTGMVSDDEIHKIGEMTGASYVLITEAAPMDDAYLVATAKIVDVESAKIENSAGSIISISTSQMETDCKKLTDKLLNVSTKTRVNQVVNKGTSEAGHEYVDLGLSVKWSTCNVGAAKPEDYGDYYAWGEVTTKSNYLWTNYRFRTSGDNYVNVEFNKYNTSSSRGSVDNKTILDIADDVANIKWGGGWRMPTQSEFQELMDYCTWTWTTQNGVNGYRVTGIKSGYTDRSIFLPAAGYRYATSLDSAGSYGYYWSSSLNTDSPFGAWLLYFNSGLHLTYDDYRYRGRSVRPVCP